MSRHRISVLILITIFAVPLVASETVVLPNLEIEEYTLDNGLHVILHEDHTIATAAVNIWYHVGSKNEEPGRTGFAHLFEHMMFQGSAHHDEDYFLQLQKIGGVVNGTTNYDRTNYWENVPADYLKRALFMEADRMGWLLPALTQAKLDNQRDVVKNEKRQSENKPYAKARGLLHGMLFPAGHPYRWQTLGSMADLSAASVDDVAEFFRRYYVPNNASLCVAGDFDPAQVKVWIAEYFGTIKPGPPLEQLTAWAPALTSERRSVAEDAVTLPRLYMAWHTPGYYAPGDAEFDLLGAILTQGKTSRLYQKLVYEMRIAQDLRAYQSSREMSGVFEIRATAAPGHTLAEVEHAIDTELARMLKKGVNETEVSLARTAYEAGFVRGLQRVGGGGGKADRLNRYHYFAGDAGYLARDLARFSEADKESVNRYARQYLGSDNRAVLYVLPQGNLVASGSKVDQKAMPGSTGGVNFTPPEIQTAELANGLKLYLVEKHELPLVEMHLNIMSGWSRDPVGRSGAAALTADLLDEGVKGYDALELAHEVAAIGAQLNTGSSFDGSTIRLNVLKSHLPAGMDFMRAVLTDATFDAADFMRVKESYLGRQRSESSQRRMRALKELQVRCFGPGHPYAQPYTGTGTPETVAKLTRDDVLAFHTTHYRPNNASLVIVGDLKMSEVLALAAKALGSWDAAPQSSDDLAPIIPYTGSRLVVIDQPGAEQSDIIGGYLSLAHNDADYQAMEVVNMAFGGQFSSRINLNLRENKGYTYSARSVLLGLKREGLFYIKTRVETGATAESLRELIAEMTALRGERPLVGGELADSCNRLVLGFPQQFETYGAVATSLSSVLFHDLPLDGWQTFAQQITDMNETRVATAIGQHIDPAGMVWIIVGDWQVIGPELAGLGLGDVEVIPFD